MLFDRLGVQWTSYREQLGQLRALVVDDEEVVCVVLSELLAGEGFSVDTATDVDSAWRMIGGQTRYDLLVADKNLPRQSGLDLIKRVNEARIDLPAVLITGHASLTSVTDALRLGAADYIAKPFPDIRHVLRRLKSVVERRVAQQLYNRIIKDLRDAVVSSGEDETSVKALASDLFTFKQRLQHRTAVMMIDPAFGPAVAAADTLLRKGLTTEIAQHINAARARIAGPAGPLVVVVNIDAPDAVGFITEARRLDPLVEVLATSLQPRLDDSLRAITAGAADFVNASIEGREALEARALRLYDLARRQRLHLNLVTLLYQRLRERNHPAARMLWSTLPEQQRGYLDKVAGPLTPSEGRLPDAIDLDSVLEPSPAPASGAPAPVAAAPGAASTPRDRRRHPRLPAELTAQYVELGTPEDPRQAAVRDVSHGGLFLVSSERLTPGTQLRLELHDRNGALVQPLVISAEVVRYVMVAPDPEQRSGVGVRLLGEHGDYARLIDTLQSRLRR